MVAWNHKDASEIGTAATGVNAFDFNKVFKPASEFDDNILFMSIFGGAGDGKSHFVLTAAEPICLLDTELSTANLIKRLPKEKQDNIYRVNLLEYTGDISAKNVNGSDVVTSNILDAIYNILCGFVESNPFGDKKGTFVIDSMSDVYGWLQKWLINRTDLKRFKDTDEMMPMEWNRIDARWKEIMILLRKTGWNVILTFKPRVKWVNGKPSKDGETEAKWQTSALHDFDLHVEIKTINKGEHEMTIKKTRFGDDTFYAKLTNATFSSLCEFLTEKSGVKLG
ncbi:MAG: hypothetical protein WC877_01300 [Dehalococcoidales bacterium]|jgi:hypothetical protein